MWAYESHLGGLYFEDERVSTRDLYCDQCDDFDEELGNFEAVEIVRANREVDGE